MNSTIVARDPAVVVEVINVSLSRYFSLASYAVLIYDLVLTLPTEISLVWPAKWSIVKLLFLINRYTVPALITVNLIAITGLSGPLSLPFCQRVIPILLYYQLVSIALVDIIVSLRIHAILRRRLSILILISLLFVTVYSVTFALASIVMADLFRTITVSSIGSTNGPMCSATPSKLIWTVWLPGLLFEAVICMITFFRVWWHVTVKGLPFREAINSDAAVYAFIELLARMFDVFLWAFAPHSLMLLGEQFAFAVTSAVCSRLLLNLRSVPNTIEWSNTTSLVDRPSTSKTQKPDLWLANQGSVSGLSFLEQIYQRSYNSEENPRLTHIDQFTVPALESNLALTDNAES